MRGERSGFEGRAGGGDGGGRDGVGVGSRGALHGWRERLVHVSTVIVIQLLCYDNIKAALLK